MKFFVHIPVAAMDGQSLGMVNGYLELSHLPRVGDQVSFSPALNEACTIGTEFAGYAEVESVVHPAGRPTDPPIVFFEPLLVRHPASAPEVFAYLANGFGLWPTSHSMEQESQ